MDALQPGLGPIRSATYLPADPSAVLWGRLPCESDAPVLTIDSGSEVTIDSEYVRKHVGEIAADADLSRYIL